MIRGTELNLNNTKMKQPKQETKRLTERLSIDAGVEAFRLLTTIADDIADIKASLLSQKKILNLDEFCTYTGFTKSYAYKLTHHNIIPYSKPNGGILFFDREKIDKWLLSNPNKTREEIDAAASTFVANSRYRMTQSRTKLKPSSK